MKYDIGNIVFLPDIVRKAEIVNRYSTGSRNLYRIFFQKGNYNEFMWVDELKLRR
jgi:hypothetical protein